MCGVSLGLIICAQTKAESGNRQGQDDACALIKTTLLRVRHGQEWELPAAASSAWLLLMPAAHSSFLFPAAGIDPQSMPGWLRLLLAFPALRHGSSSLFCAAGVFGAEGNSDVSSTAPLGTREDPQCSKPDCSAGVPPGSPGLCHLGKILSFQPPSMGAGDKLTFEVPLKPSIEGFYGTVGVRPFALDEAKWSFHFPFPNHPRDPQQTLGLLSSASAFCTFSFGA